MSRIFAILILSLSFNANSLYAEHSHDDEHSHDEHNHKDATATKIESGMAKSSGIVTEAVSKRTIAETLSVSGKVLPSEHRIAHIIPRFPGIVREGKKHIGDRVEKGEVLAIIESNQSLQPYDVRSQISGTVINGHLIIGEFVPENQWVFIIADLSEVWVDLMVPLSEREKIANGQKLKIFTLGKDAAVESTISYVAPYADDRSQSQIARAVVKNDRGILLPGMYVRGEVAVSEREVAAAVKTSALQTFGGRTVVFKKAGDSYEPVPVQTGLSDGEWTELLSGLSTGVEYVSENAFLIKADILKRGAAHDH